MNVSIPTLAADTARARVARHVARIFDHDDEGRASLWISDPRWSIATTVSDLGAALSRLGHRLHHDVAGDFADGFREGQQVAGAWASANYVTKREDVVKLLSGLGFDTSDENLAKLGFGHE